MKLPKFLPRLFHLYLVHGRAHSSSCFVLPWAVVLRGEDCQVDAEQAEAGISQVGRAMHYTSDNALDLFKETVAASVIQ